MTKLNEKTKVYVCKTDFDYHIPDDMHGIQIYFTEKDLRRDRECVAECGVVEMEIEFSKVIDPGNGWSRK